MDLDKFMSDDSHQVMPSDGEAKEIARLALAMEDSEADVKAKEAELEQAKDHYRKIEQKFLPDALAAAGVTEIALLDGSKVKVDDVVSCGLPKDEEKRRQAIEWLEENKGDDIIDRVVLVKFKRGETEKMLALYKQIEKLGYSPDVQVGVNYQTLSSWAKEQITDGMAIPSNLFNLFIGKKAKLTRKKGTKS